MYGIISRLLSTYYFFVKYYKMNKNSGGDKMYKIKNISNRIARFGDIVMKPLTTQSITDRQYNLSKTKIDSLVSMNILRVYFEYRDTSTLEATEYIPVPQETIGNEKQNNIIDKVEENNTMEEIKEDVQQEQIVEETKPKTRRKRKKTTKTEEE